MKIIQSVIENAEEGDKILLSFPDVYSFYTVMTWIERRFKNILWILWTDAAVERLNHLGTKYEFPKSGDAIIVSATKSCKFLKCIGKLELDEIKKIKEFPMGDRIIVSFGMNFLSLYDKNIYRAVDLLVEVDRGILISAIIGKVPDEIIAFHDVFIEIIKSEDSYISYHNYVAKLTFSMKGGVTVVSDNLQNN